MYTRRSVRARQNRLDDTGSNADTNSNANSKRSTRAPSTGSAGNSMIPRPSQSVKYSPGRRASPLRQHSPPLRRSSRAKSSTRNVAAELTVKAGVLRIPTPIEETKELTTSSSRLSSNLPTTLTTNTSTRASTNSNDTSSVYSALNSQDTVDLRSSPSIVDAEVANLTRLRRSTTHSLRNSPIEPQRANSSLSASTYSRSGSELPYNDDNTSKEEDEVSFSDGGGDDDEAFESFTTVNNINIYRQLVAPREFGGSIGITMLMMLVPLLVCYLLFNDGNNINYKNNNNNNNDKHINWRHLVDSVIHMEAIYSYVAFIVAMLVLSANVFSMKVHLSYDRPGKNIYTFNALPIAVFMSAALIYAEHRQYCVVDFILQHYSRFCVYGFVTAFLTALWAYCHASYAVINPALINEYGKSGRFLVDFGLGRQISPKVFFNRLDMKQTFYRISLLTTLLFAECFIAKTIAINWQASSWSTLDIIDVVLLRKPTFHFIHGPVAFLAAMQLLCYVGDAIVFEHHLASSFELQGEGFGALLLLRYASTPFLFSAVTKYFVQRAPMSVPCWLGVYTIIAAFVGGMIVKRLSSSLKYNYRLNPYADMFKGTDTLHTYQGRRLLLGRMWGCVRQPNYAGDIVALLAMGTTLFFKFAWVPAICILLCVALLLHRTLRVQARNSSRYFSSWKVYCARVRYFLLPKVY